MSRGLPHARDRRIAGHAPPRPLSSGRVPGRDALMTTDLRMFRGRVLASTLVVLILVAPACSSRLNRTLHAPEAAPDSASASGPLKGHLRDGGVLVFDSWRYDEATRHVLGTGVRLDPTRRESARGELDVPLDS